MGQNVFYASPADANTGIDGEPDAYTALTVMLLKTLGICPPSSHLSKLSFSVTHFTNKVTFIITYIKTNDI